MSSKTIAKFFAFVISVSAFSIGATSCGLDLKGYADRPKSYDVFDPPKTIGKIKDPDIDEASGLSVSKCQPDVMWTHNDSGNGPYIFAVNRNGDHLGTWHVQNAQNRDWEDIAEFKDSNGRCFIYIGEIGDNDLRRDVHTVYRVAEPQARPETANLTKKDAAETEPADALSFRYSDGNHNAETLMVQPSTGDIYVLAKNLSSPSGVYKIASNSNTGVVQIVSPIAQVQVPSIPVGLLTGGDISSDGRRVVLCDYVDGYELTLPPGDNNFDDIWKQLPKRLDLGPRDTGEAVAYSSDGNIIYATTEGNKPPIIEVRRK